MDLQEDIRQLAIAQVRTLERLKQANLLEDRRAPLMMAYYIKLQEAKAIAFELLKKPDGIH